MKGSFWQKIQPHVVAIAAFLVVTIIYCMPAIRGLMVNQHDFVSWKAMAQQSFEYKEKYGHFPLWTNSLFGGMPAFQVAIESKYNITLAWLDYIFRFALPSPAGLFFLNCIGFYILTTTLKLRNWVGIFGGLAYAFASYSAVIISVGHTTKFASMGYAPAVIAGFLLLTQRKYILGFVSTLTFTTLLLYQNHIQIVYYTLLILICVATAFLVKTLKEKETGHLFRVAGLSIVAALIGAASYAVMLMPLNEYAKETMRGGRSELTQTNDPKGNKTKGGLDKEYAFRWSYGIDETLTLVLPAFKGGSSGPEELGEKSKAVESLVENSQQAGLPEQYVNYLSNFISAYWGPQTLGTSGTVYLGVLVVLLFIAGLFLVRNWHLGWIVAASIIGILLSWGANFSTLNNFLFDHLPFYNKFRAPTMSLVIPQLTFALLASMALDKILFGGLDAATLLKKLKPAAITTAALAVLLIGIYFTSDFKSPDHKERKDMMANTIAQMTGGQQAKVDPATFSTAVFNSLTEDRKDLYGSDLLRTLFFLLIGSGLIYFAIRKKVSATVAALACSAILLIDLIPVDLRYLNSKNYIAEDELMASLEPTQADLQIKQDTGYYRVFDQTSGDPYSDSRGAYHHNLINGYHPAKLALYQDLIENQIGKGNMQVLNMLNTKYVIVSNPNTRQPMPLPNPDALGAAWFVKNIAWVKNPNEEMKALDSIKPLDTVYIEESEKAKVTGTIGIDSAASIRLISNRNDIIEYESNASADQFAVFSEIYYPLGWSATIDGKTVPIVKVNYALRGLSVPAGKHRIEFKFESKAKETGDSISLIVGILSWLLLLGGLFWEFKNYRKQQAIGA